MCQSREIGLWGPYNDELFWDYAAMALKAIRVVNPNEFCVEQWIFLRTYNASQEICRIS